MNNIDEYNYHDKFTLKRGDLFFCRARSCYTSEDGNRHIIGVKGKYIYIGNAPDGILARLSGSVSTEYIYMGPDRMSELTGTMLKSHILSVPKKPKAKKQPVIKATKKIAAPKISTVSQLIARQRPRKKKKKKK